MLSIDKNCYSCSGNNSSIVNAFKMACLAYFPSPVLYKGSVFAREVLLTMQARLMKQVEHRFPWKKLLEDMTHQFLKEAVSDQKMLSLSQQQLRASTSNSGTPAATALSSSRL